MSKKIRIAIAGVGNCASALVQGVGYYNKNRESIGLTAYNLGGFEPGDIEFVAAFDVVDTKVGKDLSEAIFEKPNNTVKIHDVDKMDIKVERAEVLDGIGRHYNEKVKISNEPSVDVAKVLIDETYQLNVGGDMDFYNMLDEERLEDKRISKTSAVEAMTPYPIPMRIGPSDFVRFLENDKICYISMKGRYFGNIPVELDLKLRVVDAYNSAGVMIDAIRGAKLALARNISGLLEGISAYCFKHPPVQMTYSQAKANFIEFVEGKRDR